MEFREMYFHLFNEITRALQAMEQNNYGIAQDILIHAQLKSEQIYIEKDDGEDGEAK